MAKTKVSEWDVVADNNQDISGITLGTGMPPSYVNDSIREMMAQIKDWQSGSSGDGWTSTGTITSNGTLNVAGSLELNGSTGSAGQVLVSSGSSATPTWGDAFVSGMIMLWSGSTDSVPTGWALCDGSNNTPDLRNRFVVGAGETYNPNNTGGSADAVSVSHSHTFSNGKTNTTGNHRHGIRRSPSDSGFGGSVGTDASGSALIYSEYAGNHSHTVSGTISSSGSSGTNKNLPPYYALAYIMKL